MDPSSPSPSPKEVVTEGRPPVLPHPLTRPTSDSALNTVRSSTKHRSGRKHSPHRRRPVSAASSRATSANGSDFSMAEYSLDLAKLGEKDSSWTLGKAGEREIERVSSRDEGPEDFTLRLGEWMRGTMPWKQNRESKYADTDNPNVINGETHKIGDEDAGEHGEARNEEIEQSYMLPLGTSTPAFKQHRPAAPPMSRMNTEAVQDHAAQEVFDQISALHAEVERVRRENESLLSTQRTIEDAHLHQQKECRILRSQVDDLKSEAKRLQASEFKAGQKALRLEQELKRDGSKVGSLRAKFEPLTQELEAVRLRAEADKQAANSTINCLRADLNTSRDQLIKLTADQETAASTHASEIEALKNEIQACRSKYESREEILNEQLEAKEAALDKLKDQKPSAAALLISTELEQSREQLTETQRILRNTEEENEILTQENERQIESIGNLQRALDEERLRVSDSADAQVAELQDEIARMQAQKTNDTIFYSEHKSALDKIQDEHATATEVMAAKHKKELNILRSAIIKAGEGMKKREQRLLASSSQEADEYKKQLEALEEKLKTVSAQKQQQPVPKEESPTVTELRSAIRALNSRLSSTNQSLKEVSAEADKYHHAASQAYQKIKLVQEENADINREMDKRIEKMMEDREREWRRRIKIMFKERETMAKALMAAWGREECGVAKEGENQRYRYKYVDKEGKLLA
ncbi:MAG: hypothetical protein LQ343_005880 [Gyalolechia ehrenbergii]|nr:MAG: hypothetical protein LQ343_005880 [Gyalolechia ehrenbergii]